MHNRRVRDRRPVAPIPTLAALCALACAGLSFGATTPVDTSLALPGDAEGAVFGSLRIEDENRVRVRFERPELLIDIDPEAAPGLVIEGPLDILDRTRPDPVAPLLASSSLVRSPHTARPWLQEFRLGAVARFRPTLEGVANWELQIVDSAGGVVMVFAGRGEPPAEIVWDGRRLDGEPAECGLTYSYVLEAFDRAGNKRRLVGDGFELPAYRLDDADGPVFLAAGDRWRDDMPARGRPGLLALEAASRINLALAPTAPVQVRISARSQRLADELGAAVRGVLAPLLSGAPDRLQLLAEVASWAPEQGSLRIGPTAP